MVAREIEKRIKEAVVAVLEDVRKEAVQEKRGRLVRKAFSGTVSADLLAQVQQTASVLGMTYYEAYEESFKLFLQAVGQAEPHKEAS